MWTNKSMTLMATMGTFIVLVSPAALAQSHQQQQQTFIDHLSQINVTELDQVPAQLSPAFRSNFIVKHGMLHNGPRGHKLEQDVPGFGIHADVNNPRIYVFDPQTAFVVSYNGNVSQEGGQALDMMTYEEVTKSFNFRKIEFPVSNGHYALNDQSCNMCHGGVGRNEKIRPIFSMYPDWPRFFGSDNDELKLAEKYPTEKSIPADTDSVTRERIKMQKIEHDSFFKFKFETAPQNPRYAPLFSSKAYATHGFPEKMENYKEYPYRSDVELIGQKLNPSDVSRAFSRRAGLRFNLLYSRLNVRQVVSTITSQSEQFEKFGKFFVYNIMRCGPETSNNAVIKRWALTLKESLKKVEDQKSIEYRAWDLQNFTPENPLTDKGHFTVGSDLKLIGKKQALLEYGQNLALFGLKINDVDIRFTYYHPDYLPESAYRNLGPLDAMQVGYLDMCGDAKNSCEKYFNSYNDGSTTMDEHLTANLLLELGKNNREIRDFMKKNDASVNRGLLDKYSGSTFEKRLLLDRKFFTKLDSLSKWFSLPYPFQKGDSGKATKFIEMHHRAPFNSTYQANYKEMCGILEKQLLKN